MSGVKEATQVALFDMDGTLCEYELQLLHDLRQLAGPEEKDMKTLYEEEYWPDHIENRIDLIRSQPGWWRNLAQIDLGLSVLYGAKEAGFNIKILTKGPSRTSNAWTEKFEWCQDHIIPVIPDLQIHITGGGNSTFFKPEPKGDVYGRVLVDDYPEYMDNWLKWRPRGLGLMPAREYNKGYKHPNVIRYDESNLGQVKLALQAAYNRRGGEFVDYSKIEVC